MDTYKYKEDPFELWNVNDREDYFPNPCIIYDMQQLVEDAAKEMDFVAEDEAVLALEAEDDKQKTEKKTTQRKKKYVCKPFASPEATEVCVQRMREICNIKQK